MVIIINVISIYSIVINTSIVTLYICTYIYTLALLMIWVEHIKNGIVAISPFDNTSNLTLCKQLNLDDDKILSTGMPENWEISTITLVSFVLRDRHRLQWIHLNTTMINPEAICTTDIICQSFVYHYLNETNNNDYVLLNHCFIFFLANSNIWKSMPVFHIWTEVLDDEKVIRWGGLCSYG